MPCFSIDLVIMDGQNSEGLLFFIDRIFTVESLLLGAQRKERVYFGKRNMKIFRGYNHEFII